MKKKIQINLKFDFDLENRVDKYICLNTDLTRNEVKDLISNSQVYLNNSILTKPTIKVKKGDIITIDTIIEKGTDVTPQEIDLNIIYDDENIAIINKESGMVVHPAPGNWDNTLANAILFKFKTLSDVNGEERPGIVHRLDKDTSGLIMICKNNESHNYYSKLLQTHDIKREYWAIIKGNLKHKITHIKLPISRDKKDRRKMSVAEGGKNSITHVEMIESISGYSLVKCNLETGRTHQIRVHLSYLGNPILGDKLYSTEKDVETGQFLHAKTLSFVDQNGNEKTFTTKLPLYFEEKWKDLKSKQ